MTLFDDQHHSEPDSAIPPELSADLQAAYPPMAVPPMREAAILIAGRSAMLRGKRRRIVARWITAGGMAAAAAIVVIVTRWGMPGTAGGPSPARTAGGPQVAMGGDLTAPRTGTILDAFRLARALRDKQPIPPTWDINGDGKIDQQDVDALANDAVRLNRGIMR